MVKHNATIKIKVQECLVMAPKTSHNGSRVSSLNGSLQALEQVRGSKMAISNQFSELTYQKWSTLPMVKFMTV